MHIFFTFHLVDFLCLCACLCFPVRLQMQKWVVFCWALLALVAAEECPDGGTCEEGQTCCDDPANGYECCPFDQVDTLFCFVFLNTCMFCAGI